MQGERKKKAVSEVEEVLLRYTREVVNKMSSNFSRRAHQIGVFEWTEHFWKAKSSYKDEPYHVSYERIENVPTKHPSWTNEMDWIPQLSGTEKGYVPVTGKNGEEKLGYVVRKRRASARYRTLLTSFGKRLER